MNRTAAERKVYAGAKHMNASVFQIAVHLQQ